MSRKINFNFLYMTIIEKIYYIYFIIDVHIDNISFRISYIFLYFVRVKITHQGQRRARSFQYLEGTPCYAIVTRFCPSQIRLSTSLRPCNSECRTIAPSYTMKSDYHTFRLGSTYVMRYTLPKSRSAVKYVSKHLLERYLT